MLNKMAEYTNIPEIYKETYDSWFKLEKIEREYHGDIMEAAKDSPVLFAYYLLGVKLNYDQIYEVDVMLNKQKLVTISSRQRGKTFIRIIVSLWAAFFNKFPQGYDNSTKIVVVSMDSEESKRYISEIKNLMYVGDARVEKLFKGKYGKHFFTERLPKKGSATGDNKSQSLSIRTNGVWSSIKAFPPNNSARGKPASILILDEVAIWEELNSGISAKEVYYSIVGPMDSTSPDCRYWVTSTPKKPRGLFFELCPFEGHTTEYKLLWIPYHRVGNELYVNNIKKKEEFYRANGEYDRFRQEYLAEFVDVGDSFFHEEEHIEKVFNESIDRYTSFKLPVNIGLDFGGSKNSHTVITAVWYDENTKTCYRIYEKRYEVGKDSTLQEDVLDISKRFNVKDWYIDSQGAGSSFYDWIKGNFGIKSVHEVVFAKDKRDMYNQFRIAIYKNRVKSYPDKDLKKEFRSFTPDYRPMKGATDDLLDSFAMACFPYLQNKESMNYGSFSKHIMKNRGHRRFNDIFGKPKTKVNQIPREERKWYRR